MKTRTPIFRRLPEAIRRNPLRALAVSGGACLLLVVIALLAAVCSVNAALQDRTERLERMTQSLLALTDDYNLLRASLGLEPRDFPLSGREAEAAGPEARSPLAQGLAVIQSRYYDELKAKAFEEFKTGDLMKRIAADTGCRPVDNGLFALSLVKRDDIYYSIAFRPDTQTLSVRTAGAAAQYNGPVAGAQAFFPATLGKVEDYYGKVPGLRRTMMEAGADPAVAGLLHKKGLVYRYRGEDAAGFRAVVMKKEDELLAVGFDKLEGVFTIDGKKAGADAFLPGLVKALEALDARTAPERRFDAVVLSLREYFTDSEFTSACAEAALTVADAPRAAEEFVYFDVLHRGARIGAFAVNRESAEVYFVDKDDVQISALKSIAGPADLKKKIPGADGARAPDPFPPGRVFTFLLLGVNEDNADTNILVQADARTASFTLVSLPRDLFHRGARINTLIRSGFDNCAREISELTGVPVRQYAAVDIYSLASLIDELGGIDVELSEDLIDPTYRIKENGVWRTLAYPRGRHHLSGVQALRVVRSRGSTSDFSRSRRQQLVLAALLEKLKARCGENLQTALSVFSALSAYVATNISPLETARYFIMFKDFKIRAAHVLDTSNILRATYSELMHLPEEEQRAHLTTDDVDTLGAYVLLPRNNDWGLFRSYIRALLSGRQ